MVSVSVCKYACTLYSQIVKRAQKNHAWVNAKADAFAETVISTEDETDTVDATVFELNFSTGIALPVVVLSFLAISTRIVFPFHLALW